MQGTLHPNGRAQKITSHVYIHGYIRVYSEEHTVEIEYAQHLMRRQSTNPAKPPLVCCCAGCCWFKLEPKTGAAPKVEPPMPTGEPKVGAEPNAGDPPKAGDVPNAGLAPKPPSTNVQHHTA